jgi:hypothetical protein
MIRLSSIENTVLWAHLCISLKAADWGHTNLSAELQAAVGQLQLIGKGWNPMALAVPLRNMNRPNLGLGQRVTAGTDETVRLVVASARVKLKA